MSTVIAILNFLFVLLEVIVLFNLIIIAHEWGHFLAARWRGLKIEEFGVWFGKPLWKKEINGVVYSLGSIPAGGFVKLPQLAPMDIIEGESDVPRETLPPISPIDKTIVAFAGPLFSFLFAIVLACVVWQVGKPISESEKKSIIGSVEPGWPADKAGLKPGDIVEEVDGKKVRGFSGMTNSVMWDIVRSEGRKIQFKIQRDGQELTKESGWGLFREAKVSKVVPNSPAAEAGLAPGDIVTYVNGIHLLSPETFQKTLKKNGAVPLYITFTRGSEWLNGTLQPKEEKSGIQTGIEWKSRGLGRAPLRRIGIGPAMTAKIDKVKPGSPASEAKFAIGDIVTHLNGKRIFQPWELSELAEKNPKAPLYVTVQRGSNWVNLQLQPNEHPSKPDPKDKDFNDPLLGIDWNPMIDHNNWPSPFQQISDSVDGIRNMLGALFSPKSGIGAQQFSGPVGIARMYFQMLLTPDGWRWALAFSVFFNVNLALLNLLPFPVLDGGHIVLAFIEGIRRKPVNIKVLEFVQTACALLLFGFILFVTFFDVLDLPWQKLIPEKAPPAQTK